MNKANRKRFRVNRRSRERELERVSEQKRKECKTEKIEWRVYDKTS